jgi:hypothetical protein
MGYFIEPVLIWTNGEETSGNYIDASIVNDNLSDYAQFYWQISNLSGEADMQQKQMLTQGNTSISGEAYTAWGSSGNINYAAYEYICEQLNLTLEA